MGIRIVFEYNEAKNRSRISERFHRLPPFLFRTTNGILSLTGQPLMTSRKFFFLSLACPSEIVTLSNWSSNAWLKLKTMLMKIKDLDFYDKQILSFYIYEIHSRSYTTLGTEQKLKYTFASQSLILAATVKRVFTFLEPIEA